MTKTLSIIWLVTLCHLLALTAIISKQKQVQSSVNTYLVTYAAIK